MQSILVIALLCFAWLLVAPSNAAAYVGPGAGLSAIGTVLALISALLLAIVGFVWYPMKRLLTKSKLKVKAAQEADPS